MRDWTDLPGANGGPLQVGRKYRTATQKALAIRDQRYIWPGCDRPPHWSQGPPQLAMAAGWKDRRR